ncbi:DUF6843 domain-containing protein [Sutcliffiella rhizosphaerae]|uniref:DUF6843 domain-containing protein n=1 Tax=Sutcliffiella rhizosphaerae TaxID=2880967 RepID=A0ABN8ADX6_9BACI|nr:hypothetical protein [Sutcliffiella rhizosphaerae]CAG9622481.1 hypothetical protein BACCIP111883_03272 [Sutcliffiella rhizosphaerae]
MRKFLAAVYSTLLFSLYYFILALIEPEHIGFFIILFSISIAGNIIYGIPVSLLSDYVTKKLTKGRLFSAGIIHIIFGSLLVFFIGGFAFFAIICAVLFFFFDELLKGSFKTFWKKPIIVMEFTIVILLGVSSSFWWLGYNIEETREETNTIFLIPDDYEGSVMVFYNVPEEPPLDKEGEYSIVPLKLETIPQLHMTNMDEVATYSTSSRQVLGYITDEYYYVDENGERIAIDGSCIYHANSGSDGNIEYSVYQIKASGCGENFKWDGHAPYFDQTREALKYFNYGYKEKKSL